MDPRDARWELSDTRYRVYFWNVNSNSSREFELTDADDVPAVLTWAQETAKPPETYVVYAVVPQPELGLIRVFATGNPC